MAKENITRKLARFLKQHLDNPTKTIVFKDEPSIKIIGYLETYRLSKRILIEVRFTLTDIDKKLYSGIIILQKQEQD